MPWALQCQRLPSQKTSECRVLRSMASMAWSVLLLQAEIHDAGGFKGRIDEDKLGGLLGLGCGGRRQPKTIRMQRDRAVEVQA